MCWRSSIRDNWLTTSAEPEGNTLEQRLKFFCKIAQESHTKGINQWEKVIWPRDVWRVFHTIYLSCQKILEVEQGIDKNQNGYDVITEACMIQFEVGKSRSFILDQKDIAKVIRNSTKDTDRIKGLKLAGAVAGGNKNRLIFHSRGWAAEMWGWGGCQMLNDVLGGGKEEAVRWWNCGWGRTTFYLLERRKRKGAGIIATIINHWETSRGRRWEWNSVEVFESQEVMERDT